MRECPDSPKMLNQRNRMSMNSTVSSFSKLMSQRHSVDTSLFLTKVKRFVPLPVLERLKQDTEIKVRDMDEMRTVTLVFINITSDGWDKMSLKDLAKNAEPLFAHVHALASKPYHEGMVRQFKVNEDGCTAVVCFGLPGFSHGDDPVRAVNFGLSVKNAIHYASVTVGITTSRTFCGTLGSLQRREYAIVGEGNNLASKLTKLKKVSERSER